MRRIARLLFTLFAAVSLLASVYCVLLEVYGEGGKDVWFQPLAPERPFTGSETRLFQPTPASFDFLGFQIRPAIRVEYKVQDGRLFIVPYWFLALVWALAPFLCLRAAARRWRERRTLRYVQAALCPACGYDLRAGHERCPECGAAAEGEGAT